MSYPRLDEKLNKNASDNCLLHLCEECAALRLHDMVETFQPVARTWERREAPAQRIADLSRITQESLSACCVLCRFFAQLIERAQRDNEAHSWNNNSLWCVDTMAFRQADGDVMMVAQNPHDIMNFDGFIYSFPRHDKHRHILRNRTPGVNFHLITEWIKECDAHHAQCQVGKIDIPNILVIDCHSRTVVSLPDNGKYVTLSYVWGAIPHIPPANLGDPLSNLPQLIEDSITVARGINFQYLWIDRYCIPHEDENLRNEQLRRMDEIYAGAEITIVSLGDDPSHGLPGVNDHSRELLPQLSLGDHELYYITPPVGEEGLKSSNWSSRAWTFQEGSLSRRLIYFTNRYMAFECRSMCGDDILDAVAFPTLSGKSLWNFLPRIILDMPMNLGGVWDTISGYNKRKLTYSRDALNAFLGILHFYENKPKGTGHYWGQPFDLESSTWSKSEGFLQSLAWQGSDSKACRLDHFPSWSWLAWETTHLSPDWACVRQSEVWVNRPNNNVELLDDFISNGGLHFFQANLSFGIHFTAWVTKVEIIKQEISEESSVSIDEDDSLYDEEIYENLLVPEQNTNVVFGLGLFDITPECLDAVDLTIHAFIVADPKASKSQNAIIIKGHGIGDIVLDDVKIRIPEVTAGQVNYSQRVGSVSIKKEEMKQIVWTRRIIHLC